MALAFGWPLRSTHTSSSSNNGSCLRVDGVVNPVLMATSIASFSKAFTVCTGGNVNDIEHHVGRLIPHPCSQGRHEAEQKHIGHAQTERPVRSGGGEVGGIVKQGLRLPEKLPYGRRESEGARSGFHTGWRPHEKFVLKELPESAQSAAHGRLTKPDTSSCPRDMALFHQRIKNDQQIEIDIAEIHASPSLY